MFKDLINNEVTIIVSSKSEMLLEYTGLLYEESETCIKLKNVEINLAMSKFQKNFFGSSGASYIRNLNQVIINKSYVISCNKN